MSVLFFCKVFPVRILPDGQTATAKNTGEWTWRQKKIVNKNPI